MADCYLVTGASAGLGAGFAARIAAEGGNLVLVARRADRLEQLAAALRQQHGVRVTVIATDLTEAGAVAQLVADIEREDIAVTHLINNAGFGLRGAFAALDGPSQARMIDLNCRVPVELAHAVLPAMLAAGRGGILNVASTAAFQPGPWMAVYYATKAFLLSSSEALHEEVGSRGVAVAALCPGPTRTEFFAIADMADSPLSRFLAGEPGKVVADGLAALRANRAVAVSGTLNAALAGSMRFTPRGIARKVAGTLQKARR
jgi:short-subunit dehydrogenase